MGYDPYDDENPTQLPGEVGGWGAPYPDDEALTQLQPGLQPPQKGGRTQPEPFDDRTRLPGYLNAPQAPVHGGNFRNDEGFMDDHTLLDSPVGTSDVLGYFFIKEPARRFGRYYLLQGDMTIGSTGHYTLYLDDPLVENPHGRVKLEVDPRTEQPGFVLYDYGSGSGTVVNGRRIREPLLLEENDEVRIGKHLFVFKMLL